MSEHPSAQPDLNKLRWNTGPGAETRTEPIEGKKDTGWAYQQKVPQVELNHRWYEEYQQLLHLAGRAPREFDSVKEGLDAVAALALFRVRQTVNNASIRGAQKVFTDTQGAAGATTISCACTDGAAIYYAQGANVYAANPDTGATLWSHTTRANTVNALACDGYRVYVGRATHATDPQIEALDPSDGTPTASIAGLGSACVALAGNGAKLACAVGNGLNVYTVGAATLTQVGSAYGHGAAINAVAIDDSVAYIGGAQGTGSNDLRAISLSTVAAQWSVALPTTAAPTVNGIASDGEAIWVVTDSVTTSSGTASLFICSPLDGAGQEAGLGGQNHDRVYLDDHYALVVRDTGVCRMIHRYSGLDVLLFGSGTMQEVWGLDPVAAVVTNGVYDFNRIFLGYPTRICQAADINDIKRRPYYAAAVPIAGG